MQHVNVRQKTTLKIIVLLYLQFVYQMVSQVLCDILVPAFPYTCGSWGAY